MNAWWVAKELANYIERAPELNEYIHAVVTEKSSDALFFGREYLKEFTEKEKFRKDVATSMQ